MINSEFNEKGECIILKHKKVANFDKIFWITLAFGLAYFVYIIFSGHGHMAGH